MNELMDQGLLSTPLETGGAYETINATSDLKSVYTGEVSVLSLPLPLSTECHGDRRGWED
jgi:hypothetical protein